MKTIPLSHYVNLKRVRNRILDHAFTEAPRYISTFLLFKTYALKLASQRIVHLEHVTFFSYEITHNCRYSSIENLTSRRSC